MGSISDIAWRTGRAKAWDDDEGDSVSRAMTLRRSAFDSSPRWASGWLSRKLQQVDDHFFPRHSAHLPQRRLRLISLIGRADEIRKS